MCNSRSLRNGQAIIYLNWHWRCDVINAVIGTNRINIRLNLLAVSTRRFIDGSPNKFCYYRNDLGKVNGTDRLPLACNCAAIFASGFTVRRVPIVIFVSSGSSTRPIVRIINFGTTIGNHGQSVKVEAANRATAFMFAFPFSQAVEQEICWCAAVAVK